MEYSPIGRVVVDDQGAYSARVYRADGRGRHGALLRPAETGVETERAALVQFAGDADLSVHHTNEFRRNSKSQAGPTESSRRRHVRLFEHVEDHLLFVLWDPNARVGHREVQPDAVFRLQLALYGEHDLPLLGELDRVAHQIDDDLAQTPRIADNHSRHILGDMAG